MIFLNRKTKTEGIGEAPEGLYLEEEIHEIYSSTEIDMIEKNINNFRNYIKVNDIKAITAISNGDTIFSEEDTDSNIEIQNIYGMDNENGAIYFIEMQSSNINFYYIIMRIDLKNNTFNLESIAGITYCDLIEGLKKFDNKYTEIKKNGFNTLKGL